MGLVAVVVGAPVALVVVPKVVGAKATTYTTYEQLLPMWSLAIKPFLSRALNQFVHNTRQCHHNNVVNLRSFHITK